MILKETSDGGFFVQKSLVVPCHLPNKIYHFSLKLQADFPMISSAYFVLQPK